MEPYNRIFMVTYNRMLQEPCNRAMHSENLICPGRDEIIQWKRRRTVEVNYKRHFNKSYMILKGETEPEELLELNVLAYNRVPGLLAVETEVADGQMRFWYEITGKQTLSDYLKHKQVNFPLLELLFRALEKAFREMEAYLLDEKNLLLDAEYVYLDFERSHLEFVYLPGIQKDIRDSFRDLMELLLRQLDHSDKRAVEAAYELYQMSLQRENSLAEMLRQAIAAGKLKGEPPDDYCPKGRAEIRKEKQPEVRKESPEENRTEVWRSTQKTVKSPVGETAKKEWGWLKQRFYPREKQQAEEPGIAFGAGEPCVIQEAEAAYRPTEVLDDNKAVKGILVYQGEGRQQDMKIDKAVFLIGKKENEVDGYIATGTVSRLHARIEVTEGEYYIEDMNSTNGTYLNGERLEYRQKVKLEVRDRIAFGVEEYIFL